MNISVVLWNIESLVSKLCFNKSEVYFLIQYYDIVGFIELFQIRDNEFDYEFESNEWVIFLVMCIVCNKLVGGVIVLVKRFLVLQYSVIKILSVDDRLYLYIKDIFSD